MTHAPQPLEPTDIRLRIKDLSESCDHLQRILSFYANVQNPTTFDKWITEVDEKIKRLVDWRQSLYVKRDLAPKRVEEHSKTLHDNEKEIRDLRSQLAIHEGRKRDPSSAPKSSLEKAMSLIAGLSPEERAIFEAAGLDLSSFTKEKS